LFKLQKDVEALKPKGTDSLESSSPSKQFQKVSKENEKLRKDLKKVLCYEYFVMRSTLMHVVGS